MNKLVNFDSRDAARFQERPSSQALFSRFLWLSRRRLPATVSSAFAARLSAPKGRGRDRFLSTNRDERSGPPGEGCSMELKLYSTLTRTKEVFRPLDPSCVRMYVCGPTVYDFAHIGNARPLIVFDVLYRLLRHLYGPDHVKYVRNVTDVDDKINARAAERGVPIRELTEETYNNFKEDVAALGCLPPTVEPRATEHIEEMKTLIERLRAADFAYVAEDHVLFHVASMPDYRKLGHRALDEIMARAR